MPKNDPMKNLDQKSSTSKAQKDPEPSQKNTTQSIIYSTNEQTLQELLRRIEELEEATQSNFEDRVWQSVLIGATSTLFHPQYMSLDQRDGALEKYFARALRIADTAILTARKYRNSLEQAEVERRTKEENDPLKSLIKGGT